MRTRYIVALGGVELGEIAPEIIVTDIVHNAPVREIKASQIAGRNGQLYTRTVTSSVGVTVYFEIHTPDVRRRQAIMEDVQRWAMPGGVLTVSDKPGRQLRVLCENLPTVGSVLKWTSTCSIGFTAYAVPFWEDDIPKRVVIDGNGSASLLVPGFAAPAGVDLTVRNTGETAVTSIAIACGNTTMTFSEINLQTGHDLIVAHDMNNLFMASIDDKSVLLNRAAQSSDDFELLPGKSAMLVVRADGGTVSTSFQIRGRYA